MVIIEIFERGQLPRAPPIPITGGPIYGGKVNTFSQLKAQP